MMIERMQKRMNERSKRVGSEPFTNNMSQTRRVGN